MEREHGTLYRQHSARTVEFVAHDIGTAGAPSFFELHGLDERLEPDEKLVLRTREGRCFTCQVLDHTNVCAVLATI